MQADRARLTKACCSPAKYALDGAPFPRLSLSSAARPASGRYDNTRPLMFPDAAKEALLPRPLSHALDISRDGGRRGCWPFCAWLGCLRESLPGRYNEHAHRHRANRHDVPTLASRFGRLSGR
jgi:hypothetical protein